MDGYGRLIAWLVFRLSKIVFGVEASDLLGAVTRPADWPSFKWISNKILGFLHCLDCRNLEVVNINVIFPANLMANSIISINLFQSYVARSFPSWLSFFFLVSVAEVLAFFFVCMIVRDLCVCLNWFVVMMFMERKFSFKK